MAVQDGQVADRHVNLSMGLSVRDWLRGRFWLTRDKWRRRSQLRRAGWHESTSGFSNHDAGRRVLRQYLVSNQIANGTVVDAEVVEDSFFSGMTLDDLLPRVSDDTLDSLIEAAIVGGKITGETLCSADESSLRRIGDALGRIHGRTIVTGGHSQGD